MFRRSAPAWWTACSRPSTGTIRESIHDWSHSRTFTQVLFAAVAGLAVAWSVHRLFREPGSEFMGLASVWVPKGTVAPVASWPVLVPFGVVYGFYTFQIVLFLFARLLGGKGSFGAQSYAQSLFYAPLAIVQQSAAVTPVAGRVLFFILALWSLVPTTTSLKAAHGYSTGRAVLTWILPVILNVAVVIVVVAIRSRAAGVGPQ